MWKEEKKEKGLTRFTKWLYCLLIKMKALDQPVKVHKVTGKVSRALSTDNITRRFAKDESAKKSEILGNGYKLSSNGDRLPKWFRDEP